MFAEIRLRKRVFLGILSDLQTANVLLKRCWPPLDIASNADVVFKVDGQKWRKISQFHLRIEILYCVLSEKNTYRLGSSAEDSAL